MSTKNIFWDLYYKIFFPCDKFQGVSRLQMSQMLEYILNGAPNWTPL
jgi:hypothetical protein